MTVDELAAKMFTRCHMAWGRDDTAVAELTADITRELHALILVESERAAMVCLAIEKAANDKLDEGGGNAAQKCRLEILATSPGKGGA